MATTSNSNDHVVDRDSSNIIMTEALVDEIDEDLTEINDHPDKRAFLKRDDSKEVITFDEFNELMKETNHTSARLIITLDTICSQLEHLTNILQEEQRNPTPVSNALKKNVQVKNLLKTLLPRIRQIKNEPLNHCKALIGHLTFLQLQNEEWRKNTHLSMLKYLRDTSQTAFSKTPAHVVPLHATRWREDSSNNYRHHVKQGGKQEEAKGNKGTHRDSQQRPNTEDDDEKSSVGDDY
jgi:hypothetical protein